MMKRIMLVGLGVAVLGLGAAAAVAADPAPAQAKLYTIESTAKVELKAGESGTATIVIKPTADNHINAEPTAPLKVVLKGEGLQFGKETLSHAEAKHAPEGSTFQIPFTALKAGDTAIEADMKFFVCTPKTCLPQKDRVVIPVSVK